MEQHELDAFAKISRLLPGDTGREYAVAAAETAILLARLLEEAMMRDAEAVSRLAELEKKVDALDKLLRDQVKVLDSMFRRIDGVTEGGCAGA